MSTHDSHHAPACSAQAGPAWARAHRREPPAGRAIADGWSVVSSRPL
eukprot:CAMPEP_0172201670 /NCGR_PEP_ID=MMETSP1050-20130122/30159_1 /TAXON_ID=233186 /ORGANISM="Cryptomonas curvata, Strain CCAP979/52" /LENGTH=46 /DNA_ID= /DNA_START= /DNA_END= /DNA_ORIENTATION=